MSKAKERNWAKLRVSGITFNHSCFTASEMFYVKEIERLLKELKDNWDKNTEEHLGIVLKPLKCHFCSKRFTELDLNVKIFKDSGLAQIIGTNNNTYICQKCIDKMS